MERQLKNTVRKIIDNHKAFQALLKSDAWAADSSGKLHNKALRLLMDSGIAEADAYEYIHEEDSDYPTIGEALRATRIERGLSQTQAAVQIGISLPYVGSVEQGRVPAEKTADKINAWINKNV